MSQPPNECYDRTTLEKLLDEELPATVESHLVQHLDGCARCRQALEGLAAEADAWDEARHLLTAREIDPGHRELELLKDYLEDADDPDLLGRLDEYEVHEFVGRGSTGVVVKALDPHLNRFVAIKILAPSFSGHGPARTRFEREGRAIAAVSHEHVVPVYAVSEFRGLPYIVMQYVAGRSLQARIEQVGPMSTCQVVRLGMQIAAGLSAAHAQGIVHRDVKPANVMLANGVERAVVTDFGLARVADEASMTSTGSIAGTPEFMSPEQAMGMAVDARADLFSLGSSLYAACTGRAPFRSESVFGVIKRVCEDDPRPIPEVNPDIDPWLVALIGKLLAKDRNERFDSAQEVAEIFERELSHLQNPTSVARPERPWLERAPALAAAPRRRAGLGIGLLLLAIAIPLIAFRSGLGLRSNAALRKIESIELPAHEPPGVAGKLVPVERDLPGGVVDGFGLYLPTAYETTERDYPILLFLCGGCSVAKTVRSISCWDLPHQITNEIRRRRKGKKSAMQELLLDSFIVVAPHMLGGEFANRQYYDQEAAIQMILAEVLNDYRVDRSRIYLVGGGRGGHGTWGLASRMPDLFAAIAPIRGETAGITSYEGLVDLPVWVSHYKRDKNVPFRESEAAVREIESRGGAPFLRIERERPRGTGYLGAKRIFTAVRSDGWLLYERPELFEWLLLQKRS